MQSEPRFQWLNSFELFLVWAAPRKASKNKTPWRQLLFFGPEQELHGAKSSIPSSLVQNWRWWTEAQELQMQEAEVFMDQAQCLNTHMHNSLQVQHNSSGRDVLVKLLVFCLQRIFPIGKQCYDPTCTPLTAGCLQPSQALPGLPFSCRRHGGSSS